MFFRSLLMQLMVETFESDTQKEISELVGVLKLIFKVDLHNPFIW